MSDDIKKYNLDPEVQRLGTLLDGQPHPSAESAYMWFKEFVRHEPERYAKLKFVIMGMADEGSPIAKVCCATLERLSKGAPVEDRYMLGLAWFLREVRERVESEDLG